MSDVSATSVIGRFAPSPTGRMHAGNIFAFLMAWLIAKCQEGQIILRIEDLDQERSRPEYAEQIIRDLEGLGLTWDSGPFYQHDRSAAYEEVFEELCNKELIYDCFCTRSELLSASAPHLGEKYVYSGRCRTLSELERSHLLKQSDSLGRHPAKRIKADDKVIAFNDDLKGHYSQHLAKECGDFIVKRSDGGFAYQLAVVVDDAEQGITSVVRGMDLLSSTPQQIYLQQLLGYKTPQYAHIPLLCSSDGRRLAKRHKDASLEQLLSVYITYEGVLGHIAYISGLITTDEPITAQELLRGFDKNAIRSQYHAADTILWRP